MTAPETSSDGKAPPSPLPVPDIRRLAAIFGRTAFDGKDRPALLGQFLQQTAALVNGAGCLYFSHGKDRQILEASLLSRQLEKMIGDAEKEASQCAGRARADRCACYSPVNADIPLYCLGAPLPLDNGCLVLFLVAEKQSLSPFLITLQLLAALLDELLAAGRSGSDKSGGDNQRSFAEDLLRALDQAASGSKGEDQLHHFNQAIKSLLHADLCVSVTATPSRNTKTAPAISVAAVSDIVSADQRSEASRLLKQTARESLIRGRHLCLTRQEENGFVPSLVLDELARHIGCEMMLAMFLENTGQRGVIILGWNKADAYSQSRIRRLIDVQSLLGAMIFSISETGPGKTRKSGARFFSPQRGIMAGLVLTLLVILLLPVPYRPRCEAIVRPHVTRFVVARYNGILQRCLVRPGDRVHQGQELARLDGRDLEVQLAALEAEREKARKQADQAIARGDTPTAQLARLDALRLKQKILGLQRQQEQLVITSPVDGIVLSGDLQRAEGSPVSRGQTLFEVAPLATMDVEVLIPADQVSLLNKTTEVRVRFDAYPGVSWQHPLDRMEPKAQIRHNRNIFLGLLHFTNTNNLLLPGMQGTARLELGKKTLAWIIFRKPWYTLRQLADTLL